MFGFNTGNTITCCKDCTRRSKGCHDSCLVYKHQKAQHEMRKDYLKKANNTSIVKSNFLGNPGNTSRHKHRNNKLYI